MSSANFQRSSLSCNAARAWYCALTSVIKPTRIFSSVSDTVEDELMCSHFRLPSSSNTRNGTLSGN